MPNWKEASEWGPEEAGPALSVLPTGWREPEEELWLPVVCLGARTAHTLGLEKGRGMEEIF